MLTPEASVRRENVYARACNKELGVHLAPPRSIQTTTTTSSSTSTSNTVPTNRHKKHRPTVVKKNKGTVAKKHRHCPKKHRSGTTVWKYTGYCCNLHQFQLKQLSKFSRIQAICALCHKASEPFLLHACDGGQRLQAAAYPHQSLSE